MQGAGNSGSNTANTYGMTNDSRVIVVGAEQDTGFATSTSNIGASLPVTAFGGSVTQSLVTTDRTGDDGFTATEVTTTFADAYAGAAMVGGVVALILEADAVLGWSMRWQRCGWPKPGCWGPQPPISAPTRQH